MPGSYSIQLAIRSDVRTIAEMSRDYIEAGLGWNWTVERVARVLRADDTNVIVAKRGTVTEGFAIMSYAHLHSHLLLFAVRRDCRRQGIGRDLLRWLIETSQVAGLDAINVELRASNVVAKRFYESAGFAAVADLPGYYRQREDGLRMRLRQPVLPGSAAA